MHTRRSCQMLDDDLARSPSSRHERLHTPLPAPLLKISTLANRRRRLGPLLSTRNGSSIETCPGRISRGQHLQETTILCHVSIYAIKMMPGCNW